MTVEEIKTLKAGTLGKIQSYSSRPEHSRFWETVHPEDLVIFLRYPSLTIGEHGLDCFHIRLKRFTTLQTRLFWTIEVESENE